jgi:hypothetical protein
MASPTAAAVAIGAALIAATAGPQQIARLSPDAFPEVPAAVRSELQRRDCGVPASFSSRRPENVVRGSFFRQGQIDVAVLCVQSDTSVILVFRGSGTSQIDELERRPNATYFQTIDAEGRTRFSRAIAVASPAQIRTQQARYGGPLPKLLDHDGIEDIFLEKASTIWYWQDGKWLPLTGSN